VDLPLKIMKLLSEKKFVEALWWLTLMILSPSQKQGFIALNVLAVGTNRMFSVPRQQRWSALHVTPCWPKQGLLRLR